MLHAILTLVFLTVTMGSISDAKAGWELIKKDSTVSFGTVKNETVSEMHKFTRFSASVRNSGKARIEIDLLSADTSIEIRDERMRNILFTNAIKAIYTTRLTLQDLTGIPPGESLELDLEGSLELNGHSTGMPLRVRVDNLATGNYRVQAIGDNSIDVSNFGFAEGIERLRGIAGLKSISTLVSLEFNLVFQSTQVP